MPSASECWSFPEKAVCVLSVLGLWWSVQTWRERWFTRKTGKWGLKAPIQLGNFWVRCLRKFLNLTAFKPFWEKLAYNGNFLAVKGPGIFMRYHERPDTTKCEFTEDGWFKTGDLCQYSVEKKKFKMLGR